MLTAKDIMTKDIITVTKKTSTEDLSKLFIEHRVSGIPVVDENGGLQGVVTQADLIEQKKNLHIPTVIALFDAVLLLETQKKFESDVKKLTGSCVEDIYTANAISVNMDTEFRDVATIMSEKDIHTLPVLDGEKLVGIIGKLDLIRGISEG